jgi:hypothetical protein
LTHESGPGIFWGMKCHEERAPSVPCYRLEKVLE